MVANLTKENKYSTSGNVPRGIANNNPGNLIKTVPLVPWNGLRLVQTDPNYYQFETPFYGLRAMGINLLNYYLDYSIRTIRGIIERWAPLYDENGKVINDTEGYIKYITNKTGLAENQTLTSYEQLIPIMIAMIGFENGNDYYGYYPYDVVNSAFIAAKEHKGVV